MNASMSDTMTVQVRDYVARVRAALSDLPPEDVEEFTTGMEADLAERLAEPGEGTLRDRLGEPDAYAAELRSAAGLPPRAAVVQPSKPVAQRLSGLWSEVSAGVLTAMPWLSDLRPFWWALRGFALACVPVLLLGRGIIELGIVGAVVSVALGLMARHRKLTGSWVGPARVVGNVGAVLLLPIAFILLVEHISYTEPQYAEGVASAGPGLFNDGEQVSNLYAYDETGRRLDKVRLLDQNGRAIKVGEDFIYQSGDQEALDSLRDPRTGELTITRDVFPLRWNDRTGWEPFGDSDWHPPMAITPLPGPVPTIEPSAAATPSPSVTTTQSPTPTTTPSAGPSASPKVSPTSPNSGVSATPTPTTTSR